MTISLEPRSPGLVATQKPRGAPLLSFLLRLVVLVHEAAVLMVAIWLLYLQTSHHVPGPRAHLCERARVCTHTHTHAHTQGQRVKGHNKREPGQLSLSPSRRLCSEPDRVAGQLIARDSRRARSFTALYKDDVL